MSNLKAFTIIAIQCLCWFTLIILLVGALTGISNTSSGPTPEAVGRIPELQPNDKTTYARPR